MKFSPKITERDGRRWIFDPLRRKYVALTPEEEVRQGFVHYLTEGMGYPREIAIRWSTIRTSALGWW